MSSPLIRTIAALGFAGYGVNILELTPPGEVAGISTSVVGVVGEFPFGTPNEVITITSAAELFDTFAPSELGANDSYPALKAFLNKTFPGGLRVVRVVATDAVAATLTFEDASMTDSVDVTFNTTGVIGNSCTIEWVANATTPGNRDAIVRIGTTYERRYENVVTAAPLAVVDPGDKFVTFAANGSFAAVPDVAAAAALATGSEGTIASADYVGTTSSDVGIRKFYSDSVDVDVLFVAECPTTLCDAVNTGLAAYATETGKGMAVYSSPAAQTKALAKTYVTTNSLAEDNSVYCWPRVKTINRYDPDFAEVAVDGNSFVAAAIASVAPEVSPGGASGNAAMKGITGLADTSGSRLDYDELNAAGVAGIVITRTLGAIIRGGYTTDTTPGKERIFRRRMTDFITNSAAARAEYYIGTPLDIRLTEQELGTNTGAYIGELTAFLQELLDANRIESYEVDPFSANLQSNLNDGEWYIQIAVKLFGAAEKIVLMANIGTGVVIAEAA